ncbi:hypothetical protein Mesci_5867 [Mesorhizobium ciceri biovar biserrulae WSM1271]|uniref:Uncharacterized protein n=2 Tax=Mesorhizobium TaxID=68287 RepID=E8TJM8_MESCW|nr:hypothetical protein Mesci_5867 [Mesorhizobium ciceri biovar biserrulae WSM1271]AEH90776.1 hypothetical protein Mesop_6441 [Mesorhizobium opportunistum WSM2075]
MREVELQLIKILHCLVQRSRFLALKDGAIREPNGRCAQKMPNLSQASSGFVKEALVFDYKQLARREGVLDASVEIVRGFEVSLAISD